MRHAEILHRCFRCGYCKFPDNYTDLNCPSYLKFRFETYSPGGRMWLLRGLLNKEIEPTPRFQEILFSCATCGNCVAHCAFPEFKDSILEAFTAGKEILVDSGKVPAPVRDYLTRIYDHGNPYRQPAKKRAEWAEDIEPFSDHEYLFYVGDVGSYDDRGKEITRSVADLMKELGVSFGILGKLEISDGNDVCTMGESALFKHLAEKNISQFKEAGVKKIIALSPHGFHALKNEYPRFGGQFQVFHYTQLLSLLIGRVKFKSAENSITVSFHDPCYLGRHNKEYWSARAVLGAIPGIQLKEMERSMQNALCCGGGGGNYFTDILGSGPGAPARARVLEAAETGAEIIAVACPICANMLEDATKSENLDQQIQIKEISEIVRSRMEVMP